MQMIVMWSASHPMGHWEQIGAERRRRGPVHDPLWRRVALAVAGCILWGLILMTVIR